MELTNLFAALDEAAAREVSQLLAQGAGIRIERIVSTGQVSPPGFWYDQEEAEWVALLSGAARLLFHDDQQHPVNLEPGDFLNIPAHRKHRVAWTSPTEPTVWLAVFYKTGAATSDG